MSYKYQKATIAEIVKVYRSIPEFSHFKSLADLKKRLAGKPHLILAAYDCGEVVGFKIGYGKNNREFYSWLGAVNPTHRGKGVAHGLLNAQEQWAKTQGFQIISVASTNRFPSMMRMLLRQHYKIVNFEQRSNPDNNKIHFSKSLI
ncbi:GNAT family N-acetyltransferase [Paraneptunicella aestuarii]|uniref:GNAT family N-acetyltransferase n=1 Tax=Paraneptunicella aestuarii TaxID=2831148 RepID=UPI001E29D775|nr:GNAT family N-acetyltransferase [Paraneptunicella aestuarii]UAA38603.1 GNAT family N-acetyltransferase [Paraneptunicella aestuarii]